MLDGTETVDDAVIRADKLMYQAKNRKNMVVTAGTEQEANRQSQELEDQENIKQQILIVDDSELNREILSEMLHSDFRILEAENGEQCVAMLEQYVDYTPSDPATWENSFRVAMEYDDGSDAFRQGVAALAQRLSHWNDANLGTITLPEDVQAYLNKQ